MGHLMPTKILMGRRSHDALAENHEELLDWGSFDARTLLFCTEYRFASIS